MAIVTVGEGAPVRAHAAGHELVKFSGRRESGEMIGLLVFLTGSRTVRRLKLCEATDRLGRPR